MSLGARQVQREVLRSIRSHALEIASRLESWGGDLWTQVVRNPQPMVDARVQSRVTEGLLAAVQRQHEEQLSTVMRTRPCLISRAARC
jgi:hypothetical protein